VSVAWFVLAFFRITHRLDADTATPGPFGKAQGDRNMMYALLMLVCDFTFPISDATVACTDVSNYHTRDTYTHDQTAGETQSPP